MFLVKAVQTFYQKDPNLTFHKSLTPLHVAAGTGKLLLLSTLYKKLADINQMDEEAWVPLHYSAQNGHLNICKYLIDVHI